MNTLNWFDSYGIKYDDEKNWVPKKKLIQLHELAPLLTRLLQKDHNVNGTKIFSIYFMGKEFLLPSAFTNIFFNSSTLSSIV